MPEWVKNAVFWQVYPLGFVAAEREAVSGDAVTHRLEHLQRWLDYAIELGASGLLLGPIFASSTHGYDTVDHFRIDPRLGDEADFRALVNAARERGLRVVLDGVFNHVGRAFPAFQQVVAEGPNAETARWFRLKWPAQPTPGTVPQYANFEGHDALVALNHQEPAVADYVTRVMCHWLERGVSGWRLDASYAVANAFWATVLPRVRAAHPDAYVVGEVIHGDYVKIVSETGLDAVTQYELWKAIWSALNERNFYELSHAIERHNKFVETFVPLTFVGNHDVTRIASKLSDARHLPHALAVLFTTAGTPSIYAGDEQAFRGVKEDRAGGDDAVRPAFPAAPSELAPYGWPTYRLHQELIGLRRRSPWLHDARTRVLSLANQQLSYEVRRGDQHLLVMLNLGDKPTTLTAPHAQHVLAGSGRIARPGSAEASITLAEHGWAILGPG
jgi:cyclomaltodextrinase